jgi:hypothetical protein
VMVCRAGERRGEFEAELAFFWVAAQAVVVGVVSGRVAVCTFALVLVLVVFFAVFASTGITPDVVALELAGLVADRQGARRPDWAVR